MYLEERKSKKNSKSEIDSNKNDCCSKREPPSNEKIKDSRLQVILDMKEKEITDMKIEMSSLKDELLRVKSRNKQLCNIIGQGESTFFYISCTCEIFRLCIFLLYF